MRAVSATLRTRLDRLSSGEHCINLLKTFTLQSVPQTLQQNPIHTRFMNEIRDSSVCKAFGLAPVNGKVRDNIGSNGKGPSGFAG